MGGVATHFRQWAVAHNAPEATNHDRSVAAAGFARPMEQRTMGYRSTLNEWLAGAQP